MKNKVKARNFERQFAKYKHESCEVWGKDGIIGTWTVAQTGQEYILKNYLEVNSRNLDEATNDSNPQSK